MIMHEHLEDGRWHRVMVTRGSVGWEVRIEEDDRVIGRSVHTDWHRVERAVQAVSQSQTERHSANR